MPPLPPECVQYVTRSGQDNDCAIAAIQMATGATYNVVLAEAVAVTPTAVKKGMDWHHIKEVLKRLGFSSMLRRKYDIVTATGILSCKQGRREHVVYLCAGRVFEPWTQTSWRNPYAFLEHEGWTPGSLLTLRKD